MKRIYHILLLTFIVFGLLPAQTITAAESINLKNMIVSEDVLQSGFIVSETSNELPPSYLPEEPAKLRGDADGNGKVNYMDALLVLRCSIGLEILDDDTVALCDVDGSSDLSYMDALIILRYSIGLISNLQ